MIRFLFIIYIFISSVVLKAQDISGRVCNAEGEPISFANVVLYQKSDSTRLLHVTTNRNGYFELKVKNAENTFLQVSCVGYQTQNVEIKDFLLNIILNPLTLREVTATAERVKKDASSEVYYITDSLRKACVNTLQLLDKLQGIKVDQLTDAIKIGEHRDVPMLVDGREAGREYIRNLNPKRIRRIEILRYPKGKYGDVPIIINVILNNSYMGFDISVHAKGMLSLRRKHSHNTDGTMTVTYATKKWNLYGNFGMKNRKLLEAVSYEQIYKRTTESTATEDYKNPNGSKSLADLNFSIGLDYKIKPQHVLSFQTWIDNSRGNDKIMYNNSIQRFLSSTIGKYHASNITTGAYYRGSINKKLHLSSDITYNYYDVDEKKQYTFLTMITNQRYKGKKNFWRINADARYIWNDRLSSTIGYTFTNKTYANYNKPDNVSLFSLEENRHQIYYSVNVNPAKNINFVVGSDFLYVNEKNDILSNGNFSWMPLAKAFWRPFKYMTIYADYYCSVQHPNLDQLSVVAYQHNDHLWHKGNSGLKAKIMHYMQYRVDVKDVIQFTYLYKHSSREITPWYYLEGERVIETLINGEYVHQYVGLNGDYALPHNVGLYFTANYQWYKRRAEGQTLWRDGHTWYLDITTSWQVHESITLISGYFLRYDKEPLLQGRKYGQSEQLMFGVQASVLKNKLSIMLAMTIPTNAIPKRTYNEIDIADYQYTTWNNDKVNNTIVQLGFRYNIGKGKISKSKNTNNSEQEK